MYINKLIDNINVILAKDHIWKMLTYLVCFLFALAGILINLNRYWRFDLGYYDFGLFDKAIWSVSRFQPPIIDHFVFSNKVIFADHFNPSIFLLTPIYWFTSKSEVLLIIQCILVGLSGAILFSIGKKLLKSNFLSFSVLLSYFLFTGLQNAVYSDFHELTVMTFFLMMTFWAFFNKRKMLYFVFFIITLGFKESLFLLGIGLSIFVYFNNPKWKKIAFISLIWSLMWGVLTIGIIIPYFSNGLYHYSPDITGGILEIITRFFIPILKIKTIFWILVSFIFLPLLAPSTWIILLLNFISRFLSNGSTRWDLGLHYNAEIAPTLAIATILGLLFLKKKFSNNTLIFISILLISTSFILYRFILHGPLALAYNPIFYKQTKELEFLDKLTKRVPKDKKIVAQNNLTLPFLHYNVWILRDKYESFNGDYIIIDARDGQNPSNYLGVTDIKKTLEKLKLDANYSIFFQEGDMYIFKRK